MTSKSRIIIAVVSLILGVFHPFIASWILTESWSFPGWLFWLCILIPTIAAAGYILYSEISKKSHESPISPFLRGTSLFLCFVVTLYSAWVITSAAYYLYIGPRAEIVFPDGFKGNFMLIIDQIIEPSLETAGKVYVYRIARPGIAHVHEGWITVGRHLPKKYSTLLRYTNGKTLEYSSFFYTWIQDVSQLEPQDSQHHLSGIIGCVGDSNEFSAMGNWLEWTSKLRIYYDSLKPAM